MAMKKVILTILVNDDHEARAVILDAQRREKDDKSYTLIHSHVTDATEKEAELAQVDHIRELFA